MINILLLGSGGREHALAWKLTQSSLCGSLYIAPGNAGTSSCGQNVDLNIMDFMAVGRFCEEKAITMLVAGPEDPLVSGIGDYFQQAHLSHITFVGPMAAGAQLEGSKDFAKQFMIRHGIPTAAFRSFSSAQYQEACDFTKSLSPPYVLKADGLAAGKGVVILDSYEDSCAELKAMLIDRKFGKASENVVIEEFLSGIEISVFVLTDGKNYIMLPEAKDYKRIGDGDTGPNTGGMGTLSPVPFANAEFMRKTEQKIIIPTLEGLRKDGIDYRGFIFFGLMKVNDEPFVIEYNVRLGDPETESILPRIESDLLEAFILMKTQELDRYKIKISPLHASTVMMVSGGYPGEYKKGELISGLEKVTNSIVFHAGTKSDTEGRILTNGGRVLAVTSLATDLKQAFLKSYASAEIIEYKNAQYRKDLGQDVFNH